MLSYTNRVCVSENQFPVLARTKYDKLVGIMQHKWVFSQSWRPEVQNEGVNRAESLQRLCGELIASLFQLLVAVSIS